MEQNISESYSDYLYVINMCILFVIIAESKYNDKK